jgi:RTX calcium-binding nonapeptide repeat (4 copies)
LLFASPGVVAAPPPNDDFADATEMTGLPAEATGSNVEATTEADEPAVGARSIWFKWTAPTDSGVTVVFSGCAQPFQDTVPTSLTFAVFVKSPVFGLRQLQPTFHAEAGRVYLVAIASSVSGGSQPVSDPDICVRLLPGPANDEFPTATPLDGFPVTATYKSSTEVGGATAEPGEPDHEGDDVSGPIPSSSGSVWYSWTAPANGPVMLRVCGAFNAVAVYTGNHLGALSWVLTRRPRGSGHSPCGGPTGASALLHAAEGETYRIAVTGPSDFQLLIGTQLAALAGPGPPALVYTGFPGQTDNLKLQLTGDGPERAVLVEADGLSGANGCQVDVAAGNLRCPVPGRAAIALDVDLGDGNDSADVDLLGPGRPPSDGGPVRRVSGGDGDDTLAGSAGASLLDNGWAGGLALIGGRGDDSIVGGRGDDSIGGGPGADAINPGAGTDAVSGGSGDDRVQSVDGSSDNIRCDAGRDRARLDGVDLSQNGCERRELSSPARAVPSSAFISNSEGEDEDYLVIFIACPLDAGRGCTTKIEALVQPGRTITRQLHLRPGRSGLVQTYTFSEGLLRRGIRVTATTRRRHGGTLKFTRRLPVFDDRYEGE